MAKTVNTSILKVYDELGNEIPIPAIKGESAYEIYKKNGGTLTETQWLASLKGATGTNGSDGSSAGFGTPTATIDDNTGTPSVTVTTSGSNTAKIFKFDFKNLKGKSPVKGTDYWTAADTPNGKAAQKCY